MRTIYKYPLRILDQQAIIMPKEAQILTCQMQGNNLVLWAIIDKNQTVVEERVINIFGSGMPIPERADVSNWIATVQIDALVWHIFELN